MLIFSWKILGWSAIYQTEKKTHSLHVHFREINAIPQSVESKLLDHFFAVPIEIIFPGESSQRDKYNLTDSVGKKRNTLEYKE